MVVRTAGNDLDASFLQAPAKCLGIVNDTLLVFFEVIGQSLLEAHSLCGNDMHQRSALNSGEYCLIEVELLCRLLVCKDQTASGAS